MTPELLLQSFIKSSKIDLENAKNIATFFKFKKFKKNDILLKTGEISKRSLFIEKGFIRSYTKNKSKELTLHFYSEGDFANNFISFFKSTPSETTLKALTDVYAWVISIEDLQHCFHSLPEFREFGRMLLINHYEDLQSRMIDHLQLSAKERYLKFTKKHYGLLQNTPQKLIASYLGMTETSLSRIRKNRHLLSNGKK